ncbi:MAG: mechanosensitive ion channel [Thiotrichaceae bacterium]|nr:mechanosensitive ion channel [Thiotrichaceae bacterium]
MPEIITIIINLDLYSTLLIIANVLLFIFSGTVLRFFSHKVKNAEAMEFRVNLLRSLSLFMLYSYLYYKNQDTDFSGYSIKLMGTMGILYGTYLLIQILGYFTLHNYGKKREVDNKTYYIATYQSRLMALLGGVLISIIALLMIVKLLGYDSALQAGGVIGFIGVFLALTNNVWAPDMFSGLIILHSNILEENNVILIKGEEPIYARVYKIKVFHTILLHIVDNHRVMIRNSRLRDFTVHNLSKFASAKGLRESLSFKIGYDVKPDKVKQLFLEVFDKIKIDKEIAIEQNQQIDIVIHDVGDHAVEWRMFYYTKQVAELPMIRHQILALVNELALEHHIDLSTPLTHQVGYVG